MPRCQNIPDTAFNSEPSKSCWWKTTRTLQCASPSQGYARGSVDAGSSGRVAERRPAFEPGSHVCGSCRTWMSTLCDLGVTRDISLERANPFGIGPSPKWMHETPSSIRSNTTRKFAANVKSAFSNKADGNISKFHIQFKSKKGNPLTMFSVDARNAQITNTESGKPLLFIPGLQDIPIHNGDTMVISEVQIVVEGGCWYAVIPTFVEPPEPDLQGGYIALDPGIRTFLTGVDPNGDVVEIGSNSVDRTTNEMQPVRIHLEKLKTHANQARHDLAVLREVDGRRSASSGRRMREPSMRFPVRTPKRKTASRTSTTRRARS
jgi:hypothetical protein